MDADDWWTGAVEEFGLETAAVTAPAAGAVSIDDADQPAASPAPRKRSGRRLVVEWLVVTAVAFGSALLLRTFVIQQFAVEGQSMLGTLHSGDRVFVNKLSYDIHDPHRGDIVVLKDVKERIEVRDLIKRVIAVPGDTVEYRSCQLFINGARITESYLDRGLVGSNRCGDAQPPVEIEPGHVFVMGDNRGASLDSRTPGIGQVPFDNLIGRAFVVVWPTADWQWL